MIPALAVPLVVVALASSAFEVTGDSTCPTPAEVARRMDELLPAPTDVNATGAARVVVTRNGNALRLILLGSNANELATRELEATGSCEDLAAAAAVVVGAWRADLNPHLSPTMRLPAGALPPPPSPPILRATAEPAPRATTFAVGLGLVASETGGDFAPGAMLLGTLGLTRQVGLDASLSATRSRAAAVGTLPDVVSWSRATLALGPTLGLRRGRFLGSVHVQALAGLLRVSGVRVPNAAADTKAELGGAAGGRLELAGGRSAIWLGLDVLVWPGDQRLVIQNFNGEGHLPWLEVVATLGVAVGRFP